MTLELWAGPECSIVRVGDRFVDQLELTGHRSRPDDLERLAALGVRAVRYPVLWERAPDWAFADERLGRLRELQIRPILGLVHHGSGPRGTSLLEDSFGEGLASFAREVAARYPWVLDYTPINEPLTTARFSGLYGHWYPHHRTDASFVRALVNECLATRAAMKAIRSVQPRARLVQTEDLGTTFSTPVVAYQAEFDNHRRFASLDLLTGRVSRAHPLRAYLAESGTADAVLASFVDDPCPPDVIGLNHYVTSDRFLDDRTEVYPPHVHGGNGRHRYADVEAVRVRAPGIPGHRALLELLWERYRLPLAITEAHLGCTSEEQIRWLVAAWRGAEDARTSGVDVRAVTAWNVFGATDWDSVLTCPAGHYEPGLFDVRVGVRPTALASVARELASTGTTRHPLAADPGWWERDERLLYPAVGTRGPARTRASQPLLVTGAGGTLGRAFVRIARARGLAVVGLTRQDLDVTDPAGIVAAVEMHHPWALVNAAGYVRVDDAEHDALACTQLNAEAARAQMVACARYGVRFATFSTDLVFDGTKAAPYLESDAPNPLNVYGVSKVLAERMVLELEPSALVVRTSAFFGPWDEANFVHAALSALREGKRFEAAGDLVVSPTYVPDLAEAALTLLVDGTSGIVHLANPGAMTWYELASAAARAAGISPEMLVSRSAAELAMPALRPPNSALGSERVGLMRPVEEALRAYVRARRQR